MRAHNRLSASMIKSALPGEYCDGRGLWLRKRPDGGGQWVLRVTIHGRRREMGLGGVSDVSLAAARDAAERWRAVAASGRDPIKEREREAREAARSDCTLRVLAKEAFESRKAELKGDGKAGRWFTPLELHVLPKLGKVPVQDIDQRDIRDVLTPIWHTKADTARKAMSRLNLVLQYAAALGLEVDLQAVAKAKALLGKTRHEPKNIPSLTWAAAPSFYATLTALRLCLERLVPVRRSATIQFDLPALEEANDEPAAARAVLEAMANGRVVPADAEVALKVIASWRQVQGRLEDRRHAEAWLGPLLMPPP